MKNKKKYNETKLPHLLNPIKSSLKYLTLNTFIMAQFVKIKEAEYSTDFDFFMRNQVHVVQHNDKTISICSSLEKRCFKRGSTHHLDNKAIVDNINQIHLDIITFRRRVYLLTI